MPATKATRWGRTGALLTAVAAVGVAATFGLAWADEPAEISTTVSTTTTATAATAPAIVRTPEDDLIDKLAADTAAIRFLAQKSLASEGLAAVPRLKAALTDPRPEVRERARWSLRFIRLMNRRDVNPQCLGYAKAFLLTDNQSARQVQLQRMLDIQPISDPIFFRLYTMEQDGDVRARLLRPPGDSFDKEADRLIIEGDDDAVESLLEGMVIANSRAAAPSYAMLAKLNGTLDQSIRRWKAEYENADGEDQHDPAAVLAYLYRAAGKPRDAVGMAREAGDQKLTLAILAGQADWRGFENELDRSQVFTPLVRTGLKIACRRLQGHPESSTLLDATDKSQVAEDETMFVPSRMYLLNDDPIKGIEALIKARPDTAMPMLIRRGDFARALTVGTAALKDDPQNPTLNAELDDLRQMLGLDQPARAFTPPLAAGLEPTTRPVPPVDLAFEDLRAKKFASAAERFEKLAGQWPDRPAMLYLRGYALTEAGDRVAGTEMMHQAEMMPLGDPARRLNLAAALGAAGLRSQQKAQADLVLLTGSSFDELGFTMVYENRATEAITAGRWADAADALDRFTLTLQSPDLLLKDPIEFLTVPANAHLMHARDWWGRGNHKTALVELDRYRIYFPSECDPVIEFVNQLDTAGDHAEADRRFGMMYDHLTADCRAYPKSAVLANKAAWLAACCNRKLDEALTNAEAAQKLDPGPGSMDTLAEVHFRRGERDAAIELSRKILAMTPDDDYAIHQAAKFAAAAVPSTTQPADEPK